MNFLSKLVSRELKLAAKRIDAGNCEVSEDEAMSLLNLGRSRFDDLVREGKIPKGRKRRGFKELVWYKDELLLISR